MSAFKGYEPERGVASWTLANVPLLSRNHVEELRSARYILQLRPSGATLKDKMKNDLSEFYSLLYTTETWCDDVSDSAQHLASSRSQQAASC